MRSRCLTLFTSDKAGSVSDDDRRLAFLPLSIAPVTVERDVLELAV